MDTLPRFNVVPDERFAQLTDWFEEGRELGEAHQRWRERGEKLLAGMRAPVSFANLLIVSAEDHAAIGEQVQRERAAAVKPPAPVRPHVPPGELQKNPDGTFVIFKGTQGYYEVARHVFADRESFKIPEAWRELAPLVGKKPNDYRAMDSFRRAVRKSFQEIEPGVYRVNA